MHCSAVDQANHTNHLKITVQTVYISNESATLVDVYFDDIKVTYTPGRVIQGNEYYPFGLQTATSWTRENNLGNNFLYNGGTELNKTTQVYDLYYRNYDPVLGRFGQVDPMASQFASLTPYNYGNNDPVYYNDPLGDCPTCGCMVCDAPDLFPRGTLPTRKYEGGSLTAFQEFVQGAFSDSYEGAQGMGLNGAGVNYGAMRGQLFNERIAFGIEARNDAYRAAYSHGNADTDANGNWGWWEDEKHYEDIFDEAGNSQGTAIVVTSKFRKVAQRGWLAASASASLTFMSADVSVPDPTDAAWPKWVGYGIAATVAGTVLYFEGVNPQVKNTTTSRGVVWTEPRKPIPGGNNPPEWVKNTLISLGVIGLLNNLGKINPELSPKNWDGSGINNLLNQTGSFFNNMWNTAVQGMSDVHNGLKKGWPAY